MPDVVMVDINLPGRSRIDCVRELRQALPKAGFLMLTIELDSRRLSESLAACADGYLVITTPPFKIFEAIRELHEEGSRISSHVARLLDQKFRQQGEVAQIDQDLTP